MIAPDETEIGERELEKMRPQLMVKLARNTD